MSANTIFKVKVLKTFIDEIKVSAVTTQEAEDLAIKEQDVIAVIEVRYSEPD